MTRREHVWLPFNLEVVHFECKGCVDCCVSWPVDVWDKDKRDFRRAPAPCPAVVEPMGGCRVYDGIRSDICKTYPWRIADGALYVDAACPGLGKGRSYELWEIVGSVRAAMTLRQYRATHLLMKVKEKEERRRNDPAEPDAQ